MFRLLLAPYLLQIRIAMRRAAFGAAGGLLILIGVLFLIVAAAIALSALLGPMLAMLVLGLIFVGLGLIVFAIAGVRPVPPAAVAPPPAKTVSQSALVSAFIDGLNAGKAMRRP